MSAGSRSSGCSAQTALCETPLSIQTSIVSLRFVVPGGRPSSRARVASSNSNQMFDPRSATRSASFRMIFASRIASIFGIKNGEWHTPASLPRDHPVRTRFDRAGDAVFTPRGNPLHFLMDRLERLVTQRINADEELFDIAKDDRRFRAPTVRIRVMKILYGQQHAAFFQQLNDVAVGIEDIFSSEIWQTSFFSKAPVIVHRRKNSQVVRSAQPIIVFTVTGGDVHSTCARVHGYEISCEYN